MARANYYSVPDRMRRIVEGHQLAQEIRILDRSRPVARHPVVNGRKQYFVDPGHLQGNAARARAVRPPDHGYPLQNEEGLSFVRLG